MAKAKSSSGTNQKKSFGKRKMGKAKKSYNKHSPKPKEYIGQGR
jgi:hypothetical protein